MSIKIETQGDDVLIECSDGSIVEVREWHAGDMDAGDLAEDGTRISDAGCTYTRRDGRVIVTEPARGHAKAA